MDNVVKNLLKVERSTFNGLKVGKESTDTGRQMEKRLTYSSPQSTAPYTGCS